MVCTCNSAGAVFNLICDDNDELVMSKIEQYFDIQVPEVNSLAPHPTFLSRRREDWNLQIIIWLRGFQKFQNCSVLVRA